ncbi:MAG TPA: hypothetical protein VHK69_17670, partial [Chitinophagaceae bacterium]|nr:hypothetical protein [Chitinophagaceae bacterium]
MFKRTNGYILLALLVVTGLAGRISSDTISSKERRTLTGQLKDTRNALVKSVKGLTAEQLA